MPSMVKNMKNAQCIRIDKIFNLCLLGFSIGYKTW